MIIGILKLKKFGSIIEIGCASGANLYKIRQNFPNVEIGGVDINKDAIEMAKQLIPSAAVLEVSDATKVFLSDKSVDIVLTDMALIYISPFKIGKAIDEIKRVARKDIILCEFYHKNWIKRQFLRLAGYNAYNYKNLLARKGFWDIEVYKLNDKDWPGGQPQKTFGSIVLAKV